MKRIIKYTYTMFSPNKSLDKTTIAVMVTLQILFALFLWINNSSALIPKPAEIFGALGRMITQERILPELWGSAMLCVKSMVYAIIISLLLSYLTVLPFFRPITFLVSKGRFLGLVGLSFVFTIMTNNGSELKTALMVFAITVFMVTSLMSVVGAISKSEFDYGRTLRMSEWEIVWHVVILGRLEQVLDVIRQNFAISWTMLTMVEGISRSDGGIGTVLLNQNKHLHLDAVFAIQLTILIVGILMDYILGVVKNLLCPYASLTLERK